MNCWRCDKCGRYIQGYNDQHRKTCDGGNVKPMGVADLAGFKASVRRLMFAQRLSV